MQGVTIEANTVPDAYAKVLRYLLENGQVAECQARPTREVIGARIRVEHPLRNVVVDPTRKFNYRYLLGECMWNLCPRSDVEFLKAMSKGITKFVEDQPEGTRAHAAWAYGPQIFPDLDGVIRDLRRCPTTRRALLRPGRATIPGADGLGTPPCLEVVQFFRRGQFLDCVVFMRSNDSYLGMPYDMFTYTTWQRAAAVALGDAVGSYTHLVGSLHLYERDITSARSAAATSGAYAGQMLWAPDLREAADGSLSRDLDDVLAQLQGRTIVQPFGWRAKSWAQALEICCRSYTSPDPEPLMAKLRETNVGVGW